MSKFNLNFLLFLSLLATPLKDINAQNGPKNCPETITVVKVTFDDKFCAAAKLKDKNETLCAINKIGSSCWTSGCASSPKAEGITGTLLYGAKPPDCIYKYNDAKNEMKQLFLKLEEK